MPVSRELVPAPPDAGARAAAEDIFGDRLAAAARYAGWLAGPGATRGVVGPREAGRVWDRHLLNCALVADLVPAAAHVVDVGSGGGLPGVVLALARPDVRVTLVDSMARRTLFLTDVVADLALSPRVEVVRARAETLRLRADVATARAVADLATVAAWSAGLVRPAGLLLAIRGAGAHADLAAQSGPVSAAGWQDAEVVARTHDGVTPCHVVRAVHR
ncbi:MAG: 16S rRNA (guanine(527)-N(7))-methyltransferase RsmG [Mycobacteriales bacterium]